ncbi:hypothetical protein DXG03_002956 [Asterophora parasitica]|uniref:DUF6699 domain-containing protein n=1 Tax=Asterophora parasitica TaxID=117018 RepID=A0A9P7KAR0_9AGAR|nr:hypothetical protein DXG03_002956 [Asterophora parasitica]
MSTSPKGTRLTLPPLLLYSQHELPPGVCTALLWDVRDHPTTFACPTGAPQYPLHAHDLMQFATTPVLKTLRITCGVLPYQHYKPPQLDGQRQHPEKYQDHPQTQHNDDPFHLPHPAHRRVHSDDSSDSQLHDYDTYTLHHPDDTDTDKWAMEAHNPHGVTVLDVLTALYTGLQTPLTHDEWDALSAKQQKRVSAAFDARWRLAGSEPGAEEVGEEVRGRGVVRADCLLHHTLFAGLTVSLVELKSCVLTVRRPQPQQSSPRRG